MNDVTRILSEIEQGSASASMKLLPLVYDELRSIAAQKMARERASHTLQPTALVHEAWLRLVGDQQDQKWNSRGHFFSAAAEAMRRILIEAARQKSSLKGGAELKQHDLNDQIAAPSEAEEWENLLALDEVLPKLKSEDEACYQLVMLRFFSGLTVDEAAESLGISPRTAKRNWSYARAWLLREIDGN